VVLTVKTVKQRLAGGQASNVTSDPESASRASWPADAPPPAIAPFDAAQAKQHQEAWAKYLGVPVEYTNSIGMKFILVPPGEFVMGSTAESFAWRSRSPEPFSTGASVSRAKLHSIE
jgi:formylglycine-generating enzyme required for sulfatase activity